jgi:hypothetical protein
MKNSSIKSNRKNHRNTSKMIHLLLPLIACTTIGFQRNFHSDVTGPMHETTNISVFYDLERAKCHHDYVDGVNSWCVEMDYTINGIAQTTEKIAWFHPSGYPRIYRTPTITDVPEGDIEIWFKCSNSYETIYDSNNGKNFKFHINKIPTIVFKADHTECVEYGPIVKDGSVKIDYDLARAECSQGHEDTWAVSMHYSLYTPYGLKNSTEEIVHVDPDHPIEVKKPIIRCLPKSDLVVWFDCSSSSLGPDTLGESKRYAFPIQ